MIGAIIGKSIPHTKPVIELLKLETPTMSIPRRIVPEVMFPNKRKLREMTFAKSPMMSRKAKKKDISISAIFATIMTGKYTYVGIFHLVTSIYPFPVSGK